MTVLEHFAGCKTDKQPIICTSALSVTVWTVASLGYIMVKLIFKMKVRIVLVFEKFDTLIHA